jgi:hypothetical protein
MPIDSTTSSDAYLRGVATARAALALQEAPLDLRLYAHDGEPVCTFGSGLGCLNGMVCQNPRHPAASVLRVGARNLFVALGRGVWR